MTPDGGETQPADTPQHQRQNETGLKRLHAAWFCPIIPYIRMSLHTHGSTAHMCLVPSRGKKGAFEAPGARPRQTQQSLLETTWHTPTSQFRAARWQLMCVRRKGPKDPRRLNTSHNT